MGQQAFWEERKIVVKTHEIYHILMRLTESIPWESSTIALIKIASRSVKAMLVLNGQIY